MASESTNPRFSKMTKKIKEVINKKYLLKLLEDPTYIPKGYWGTAPTGRIHVGYLCPLFAISDLVSEGCEVTILLADIHAHLDNRKSPIDNKLRTEYYKLILTEILRLLNVNMDKIKFVLGSDYQYSCEYIKDLYSIVSTIPMSASKDAGTEVVKSDPNPKLCDLIYPVMQGLDEKHLKADFELGGIDQRKIFAFSIDHVHKFTKKKITYLMNEMVPPLSSVSTINSENLITKMSSSDSIGKIDLLDNYSQLLSKFKKVYCKPCDIEDNTILILCHRILFPLLERLGHGSTVIADRLEKYGGRLEIKSYDELVKLYANGTIFPDDLKKCVAKTLSEILKPIHDKFSDPEMISLLKKAY